MKRKTSKIALTLSIFFVLAMFAGCRGLLSPVVTDESPAGGTETVPTGKILVVANLKSAESSSRAAVPSAMSSTEKFSYFGALKISESDTSAVYKKGTLSDGKLTFEFNLPSATTDLILEVVAYLDTDDTFTEKPDKTPSLSAKKSGLSVENNTITISEKLALKPTTSTGTGSVNLSITLPSTDYSLEVKNSTDSTTFTASQTGATVKISASDISAKSYTLVFFVKKDGNFAYGWTETIVVYAGMTTDAWLLSGGATSTEAKEINEDTITNATAEQKIFYVRGSDFSDDTKSWYSTNLSSATASDSNLGTLMKPFATVQTAIDKVKAVNDGSSEYTIYVDGEFTAESGANVAKIEKGTYPHNLSIIGLGNTKSVFKGNGVSVVVIRADYTNNNSTVTIQNIKITGGGSDSSTGGGINAGENSDLSTCGGTIKLVDCEISGNRARTGGGISYIAEQNGTATLTLDNCVVTKNTAVYGGGIYAWRGTVILDNGTVIGDASSTLNSVVGESNCGQGSTGVGGNLATTKGGGICLGNVNKGLLVKEGCYVSANYCSGSNGGGGIFIESGVEFASVDKAKIESGAYVQYNYAANTTSGNGGGIYTDGKPITIEGNIIGNKAAVSGGGVYSSGTLTLNSGAKIQDNAAATNGGAIYTTSALTIPSGVEISGNNATNGGGIYLKTATDAETEITGGVIKGNTATNLGGAFAVQTGKLTISGNSVIGGETDVDANTANKGGAIFSQDVLNVNGGSIKGNKAEQDGGAFYVAGTTTIDGNADISSNVAGNSGGAIWTASELVINAGTISNNKATSNTVAVTAGAIFVYDGTLVINGGTISGNEAKTTASEATSSGGAIYLNYYSDGSTTASGNATVQGGVLKGNSATYGGTIFVGTGNSLTVRKNAETNTVPTIGGDSLTDANTATSGGAIYNSGTTSISGGIIKGNSATYGGAIFNLETLNLSDTAKINDDIYLYTDKHITITATLTETTPVATITPASYTTGTQVLTAGDGVTLADEAPKFAVTPDPDDTSTKWIVGENGCLAKELTVAEACEILYSTSGEITLYVNDVTNENLFNLTNSIYAYGIDDNAGDVTLIITGGGITEIGEDSTPPQAAFYSCTCLVSLTIPNSVKTISAGQFTSCTNLETVTFANTSGWYYMDGSAVTVITASELSNPTTNATNLKASGAWSEKELKCSTLSTTEIDSAGSGETISPSVTLENLNDLESLKTSVLAATTRGAIINLTLTVTVKSQTELEKLANYLDNAVMTESKNIEKLSIDLIIADDSTIETIGTNSDSDGMFDQHTHLKTIKLPEGLKEITDGAFNGCENLTTVKLPTTMQTIGTDAFKNCLELSSINLPEGISTIGDSAFDNCTKLQSVTLPSTLTKIGDFAFYGTALSSITIPSSVTFTGAGVFADCNNLSSVEFSETSNWYASGEEDLSDFEQIDVTDGSTNAQNLYTNDMGIEGVWSLKYLYRKIDVNTAITQLTNATSGNLTLTVEVTSSNLSSLVTSLKSTGAESVDLILTGEDITTISTNTFRYAKKLRSIVLPDTLTKIGDCSFSECTQLQSVVIPNSVTEINTSAFSYCYALTEITIPSSVQLIGAKVFESCTALNSVTIENPENKTWYYTSTYIYASNKSNGTEIDLSNPETNATYFRQDYMEKYWYREN